MALEGSHLGEPQTDDTSHAALHIVVVTNRKSHGICDFTFAIFLAQIRFMACWAACVGGACDAHGLPLYGRYRLGVV